MQDQNNNYLSYLLRIWKDCGDGEWRYTLQNVFNGECFHFSNLYELYEKLCEMSNEGEQENRIEFPYEQFSPQYVTKVEKG